MNPDSTTTTPSFDDLGVPNGIARALERTGIEAPFPIQAQTLEHALAGRDLCGKAPTGSGKTLAFSIPVAVLAKQAEPKRPTVLILTPTRELAGQIREVLLPLTQVRSRKVATIYGGTSINRDIDRLKRGVDVVVATPGRLEDLLSRRVISLADVSLVVLDEADRMADMGFLPVVKRLLDQTSEDRQTLLFSATLDGDIDVLVKRYQNDPVTIEVEGDDEDTGDVRHLFWPVEHLDRKNVAMDVCKQVSPAIVFTRTKRGADRLAKQLNKAGVTAEAIHGDRSQNQRERALKRFGNGTSTTLVATDVAARGIHVDNVAVVLHFDPAGSDKDYVHRSGRTGRAGKDGVVVTLVTPEQRKDVDTLQRDLGITRGLHALDTSAMTSREEPTTVMPTMAGAPSKNAGKKSSGNRSRGGGNGGRSRGGNAGSGNTGGNTSGSGNGHRARTAGGEGEARSTSGQRKRGGQGSKQRRQGNGPGQRNAQANRSQRGKGGSRQRAS